MMKANCMHISRVSVVAFLLTVAGSFTGAFIWGKPALGESRVSVAVTSISPNGLNNTLAVETVFPQGSVGPSGVVRVDINYGSVGEGSGQVVILGANITADSVILSNSLEAAVARAIDVGVNSNRYGDVINIIRAWQGDGFAGLD